MKKRIVIVIKCGSALLTNRQGKINKERISEICRQVAQLSRLGHRVAIVSSGAVASDKNHKRSKNLRAAIGQGKIFSTYANYLATYGLEAAQLLLTDEQLLGGNTDITKSVILEAFQENVICIINANDVIDSAEINALEHCSDNDKLMELVCYLIEADVAIIAFAEAGVLDANRRVIHEIRPSDFQAALLLAKGGSALGHGKDGMQTKIMALNNLAASGTRATLAPGRVENFILRAFAGETNFGTKFLAE